MAQDLGFQHPNLLCDLRPITSPLCIRYKIDVEQLHLPLSSLDLKQTVTAIQTSAGL